MVDVIDSKVVVGVKRAGEELEKDSDLSRKHVKMRDLVSVLQSEGIDIHDPENTNLEETEELMDIIETQSSQVIGNNANENIDQGYLQRDQPATFWVGDDDYKQLDLNCEVRSHHKTSLNDTPVCRVDVGKRAKDKNLVEHRHMLPSSGNHLDLNAEDVGSSVNQHLSPSYRSQNHQKDALAKWKEMKQNGFMSTSYGGIPVVPKPRGRKTKSQVLKQKMEQAKKEQVDRFTKIATPSGLLNGLNPGIINHVRNSKQVHSIIQALVRSEKQESRRKASEATQTKAEEENMGSIISCNVGAFRSMQQNKLVSDNTLLHSDSFLFSSENTRLCRDKQYVASHANNNFEDDGLALKLSSPNIVTESSTYVSNADSANVNSVGNLSVKAASVASQWLHLLQQDIKGRLSALRCSKSRVLAVISTELPFLLTKGFASTQDKAPYCMRDSDKVVAELHRAKWSKLLQQMDSSLSEEEKQLECWLNQVNKMMLHCNQGLNTMLDMQQLGTFPIGFRLRINDPEKDLSVRAAAASIYSTCSFVSSMENVSCY